jgi:TonB-linked SusC/RagA family outer membrane protein
MKQSVPRSTLAAACTASDASAARYFRYTALLLILALVQPAVAQVPAAGRATITGVVKEAESGAPVLGAIVNIPGTPFQTISDAQGRYTLRNVPMGNQTIDARRVGFSPSHDENVQVNSANFVHDIKMIQVPLSLAAVTTAATVDPTSGYKTPFVVDIISAANLPAPSTGATINIQGKVAGVAVTRSSGTTNGDEPWVQVRGNDSPIGRGQTPLVMVDGVPLNMVRQVNSGTTVSSSGGVGVTIGSGDVAPLRSTDIEGLDIASVEIIKGSAAAALYGSQAANGVIFIKTKRGIDVELGKTEVELRTDYGIDQVVKLPAYRTQSEYLTNSQGQWVDLNGNPVSVTQRVLASDFMVAHPYPALYSPVNQVFQPASQLTTLMRVSQLSATNNFSLSYTRTANPGVIKGAQGATNQSIRLNVDNRPTDQIQLSFGANFNQNYNVPTVANFPTLYTYEPYINLLAPDRITGQRYIVAPDSNNVTNTNPLYTQSIAGNWTNRTAAQLSGQVTYRPLNWLSFVGNVGYNLQNAKTNAFTPPGVPSDEAGGLTIGSLAITTQTGSGLAAYLSTTAIKEIGQLTARVSAQVEESNRDFQQAVTTGTTFNSVGSQTLSAATVLTSNSYVTVAKINSGFGSLALDYDGKYIGDFLLRREGSSLYGANQRWHNFSRATGAWLMSREEWFPKALSSLTLAKLRYSYGTSGNEPDFNDRFGAVSVTTTGFVRGRLGNPNLKPETKTETEMGADIIWKNKISLSLTYSKQVMTDALVEVEAPNVSGFNTYEKNAGHAHGDAIELSLEGLIYQKNGFKWSTTVNLDRSRSVVDTYGRSCYNETPQYIRVCDGVPITQYWGQVMMQNVSQLPASRSATPGAWQVDNNGYLVPVGAGNNWWEGASKHLWGTTIKIDGVNYNWGVPQPLFSDSSQTLAYQRIGDWAPTFNFGWGNHFTYKNFAFYVLFSGTVGGDIYNGAYEWLQNHLQTANVSMVGVPDSLKKPYLYFVNLPGGGKSSGLTAINGTTTQNNSSYVYGGSFFKLAELNVQYSLSSGNRIVKSVRANRLILQLSGLNLFRLDGGYPGLDQEGFYTLSDQVRIKFDQLRYPLARRFTTSVSLFY